MKTGDPVTNSERRYAYELNHRQQYATIDEIDWLRDVAPELRMVVILGAGPGIMAAALKDGNIDVRIHLVDIDTCHYAIAHLRAQEGYGHLVTGEVQDSARAGLRYQGPPIDLLIVDADHSEIGVRSDIAAWLEHVRPGGYLFFHDYDATETVFEHQERYPGVKEAVGGMLHGYTQQCRVGTAVVYRNALAPT